MGRTITPKYRIEFTELGGSKQQSWDAKSYGRANAKNLERWRTSLNNSYLPGQVNYHISKALNTIPHVSYARLVNQKTGEVVAEAKMSTFEVVGIDNSLHDVVVFVQKELFSV